MIDLDCSEIKDIVESIRFEEAGKELELTFAGSRNNKKIITPFEPFEIERSLRDLEKKLTSEIPALSSEYILIENAIMNNIDQLVVFPNNKEKGTKLRQKIEYLRKYEKDGKLYESILIGDLSKFIVAKENEYDLIDEIEVGNYIFLPGDSITTHNPIPYSFTSEHELSEYIELAKDETFDSLFEKTLTEFRIYVNADEHTLVIFAADTVYSYFQDKFGITHYNILVGIPGSGKSSALLVFGTLGYRPFQVTSASAANYHTFLGEIQEGQGTIIEDEADNLGQAQDKKNIFKTGYSSGGTIPKIDFPNGRRTQGSYLTFCHKWSAMEELPDEKSSSGILDRCFIHHFVKGEVDQNIKKVMKDTDSESYKKLIHLRKLLFAFKLRSQHVKFPNVRTNLSDREDELTHFLISMFYGGRCFEMIRSALSQIIHDKSYSKGNSLDARITETLKQLIETQVDQEKDVFEFSNEIFYSKFKEVVHADDNSWDLTGSKFYLPDGSKISKYRLSRILDSKFKARPMRTNHFRGFSINRKDIEKIEKQYEIISEIRIIDDRGNEASNPSLDKRVTDVTQVTEFKDATPLPNMQDEEDYNNSNNIIANPKIEYSSEESIIDTNVVLNIKTDPEKSITQSTEYEETTTDVSTNSDYSLHSDNDNNSVKAPATPSNCVTSVTNVTATPPQYPCFFCGDKYKSHIDFDMGNHFIEKHKDQLYSLPISGNRERKIDGIIMETKRRLVKDLEYEQENEDRGY